MKETGVRAKEFRWKPGENDAQYIRLLKRHLEEQHKLTGKAIARIKEMTDSYAPVVRCKHCKYFNLETHQCENDRISTDHEGGASYSLNFWDYDYCSFGKKREFDIK